MKSRRTLAMERACTKLGVALVAASLLSPAAQAIESPSPEYAVKAAYLSKFGLFVDWPKSAFSSPTSDFVVCVLGANPFGDTLDKLVAGEKIGPRGVEVRYLKEATRNSGCTILYVGHSDSQTVAQALAAVNGAAVLTVTDQQDGTGSPGIVDFVVQDSHVRYTIDQSEASQNGLSINFHLLDLALAVKGRK